LTKSVIVGACVARKGVRKMEKLKIKAKTGIQNGRLNYGNCFHPSIPSIPSTPKKLIKEKAR